MFKHTPLKKTNSIRDKTRRRGLSRRAQLFSHAIEPLESRFLLTAAPTTVNANNGTTPTDIQVTWSGVSGATGYQLWRNSSATTNGAQEIASNVSGTFDDDTNLTVGNNYFYWVITNASGGNSGYSTIASATAGTVVFNDTFGATGISSAWGKENTTDPNNGEVNYVDNSTTEYLTSDPNATDGQALAMSLYPVNNSTTDYDSAEISTRLDSSGVANNLEYGEIEARIQLPGGNNSAAIWPAFWMLGTDIGSVGWPNCGEIDIMENDGANPGTNDSTLHGPQTGQANGYNGGGGVGSSYTLSGGQDFYSSFHTFAVNWGPNFCTFSIDGTPFATITPAYLPSGATWVFNGHPFYIILDVNEGGGFAPGTITSEQTMYVDWVRAYSFSAPTNLVASVATSSSPAHVSWAAVTGATSYEVWRNSSNNSSSATELNGNVTTTSYNDTSATSGTNYYYFIVAGNAAQTSNYSAGIETRLTPTVTIATPPTYIAYDGTSDVTNWATATLTGVSGKTAPTGSPTLAWYAGTTTSGTPLSSAPTYLGTYTVVANYAGDTNYIPTQSAPTTFTIQNPVGLSTSAGAAYNIAWSSGTPSLNVTAGTITLSQDLSTTFPNYNLSINTNSTVVLNATQHLGALVLTGGTIDISYFSFYIDYGSNSDPITTIAGYMQTGYNQQRWTGQGGITSSAAAANPFVYAVGYADFNDPGNPAGLPSGTIYVRYTLLGDANLDGTVNGSDFSIMAANFGLGVTGWDEGNFLYGSSVNGSDFSVLAANFGQGVSIPAAVTPIVEAPAATVTTVSTSASSVSSQSTADQTLHKAKGGHATDRLRR